MRAYGLNQIKTTGLLPGICCQLSLCRGGESSTAGDTDGLRCSGSCSGTGADSHTVYVHVRSNYYLLLTQISIDRNTHTHTHCTNQQLCHQHFGMSPRVPPVVQVLPSPAPLCLTSAPSLLSAAETQPSRNQREGKRIYQYSWYLVNKLVTNLCLTCSAAASSLRVIVSAVRASISPRCSLNSSSSLLLSWASLWASSSLYVQWSLMDVMKFKTL